MVVDEALEARWRFRGRAFDGATAISTDMAIVKEKNGNVGDQQIHSQELSGSGREPSVLPNELRGIWGPEFSDRAGGERTAELRQSLPVTASHTVRVHFCSHHHCAKVQTTETQGSLLSIVGRRV